ncbi:hypothetical protein LWI29_023173 [Acer saccharum]|uniref:ribulose-phosphate 3-epimerase n=1 Tax=Acer saccharum TaxID=4024 RepID=A0AA39VTL3_ACESA|nr:hypothetical protein LWI29_023173 [Acer saccharum]
MVDPWWSLLGAAIPAVIMGQALLMKKRRADEQRLRAGEDEKKALMCERVCTSKRMLKKVGALSKTLLAYLDCHLMVTNPLDYVEPMGKAGASGFTFHIEASKDNWHELVQKIKSKGMSPGVALKPGTPIEEVFPLVEADNPVDMVLVMTVEPGFGGQKFMADTMDKVRTLRKKYPSLDIEVDGGLGPSTIAMAASAGANCIVAGSSVFGAAEPAKVISLLKNSVEEAQFLRIPQFLMYYPKSPQLDSCGGE